MFENERLSIKISWTIAFDFTGRGLLITSMPFPDGHYHLLYPQK